MYKLCLLINIYNNLNNIKSLFNNQIFCSALKSDNTLSFLKTQQVETICLSCKSTRMVGEDTTNCELGFIYIYTNEYKHIHIYIQIHSYAYTHLHIVSLNSIIYLLINQIIIVKSS